MSDGGVIVGSIPNVRYYKNLFALIVRRDWRYTDKGILDATHLRFFTQNSFQRSLRESGFSKEKMRGINSAVYLKQQYCTSPARTAGNVLKYILRLIGFLSVDILTLGHSADIKYAQFGFRFRRDPDEASSQFLS